MAVFIHFLNGNNRELEDHYFIKGYRNDVFVEIDTIFYEVYFFTKDSLEYEMRKDGFFSLPGIIILDEITLDKIIASVNYLLSVHFFDVFKGYSRESILNGNFSNRWYVGQTAKFTFESASSFELGNG